MKTLPLRRAALALCLCLPLVSNADERESLESLRATTTALIRALVQQGVLTQEKADQILRDAAAASMPPRAADASAPGAPVPAGPRPPGGTAATVHVPYVPEFVKQEITAQVRKDVMAQARQEHWAEPSRLPEWLDRFKFSGEMTLRFQDDLFRKPCSASVTSACNLPALQFDAITGENLANTTQDRQQLRYRVVEGAEIKVSDEVQAEFRLATGSSANPVTTFQTLGSSFERPVIGLDRGDITYTPRDWLKLQGGRFGNPFFSTDLVWYDRIALDGVAATATPKITDSSRALVTIGAFPLQDLPPTSTSDVKSKWLYAAQAGGDVQATEHLALKMALAFYDYVHVEGVPNDATGSNSFNALSAPQFAQGGNSLFNINGLNGGTSIYGLAAKFRVLDFTTRVDLAQWEPVHFTWLLDIAKNVGFDQNEIAARSAGLALDPRLAGNGLSQLLQPRTRAYGTRFILGHPSIAKAGDWQGYLGYKYIQRDAVLDAFNDPDFHLGGTDAKGWIAGGGYGLDRDTWLSLKYFATESIDGPPLSLDTVQVDFNVRF